MQIISTVGRCMYAQTTNESCILSVVITEPFSARIGGASPLSSCAYGNTCNTQPKLQTSNCSLEWFNLVIKVYLVPGSVVDRLIPRPQLSILLGVGNGN